MDELKIGIGNTVVSSQKFKAMPVKCMSVSVEEVRKKVGNELVGKKVVLTCKHPESQDPVKLSNISYIKNKQIKTSALWLSLDDKSTIIQNTALADCMRHYGVSIIEGFKDVVIQTETDEKGYLIIKSY